MRESDHRNTLYECRRYAPFEDEVAAYIKETDNHVMYRVTPFFEGDDLVASGVQMQAESVEDDGVGISFNVYVYNVQPYVVLIIKPEKTGKVMRLQSQKENGQTVQKQILQIQNQIQR